jgi:hypothetical protein
MDTALAWAEELGPPPPLPSSLRDVPERAKLVDAIDESMAHGSFLHELTLAEKIIRQAEIATALAPFLPDVRPDQLRLNIALRLWSGCLAAAKTIAPETRTGVNTPELRHNVFGRKIDPRTRLDPVYRAGVEAAPVLKKLRGQEYALHGVPGDSVVRAYA